jgi:serine/threonine protein kinase
MNLYVKTTPSSTEHRICVRLLNHKLKNVVQIHDVVHSTITMEKLNVNPRELTLLQRSRIITDMLNVIKQLNDIGIIYADIKLGNIGWSVNNECWKLYDFDMACMYQNIDMLRSELIRTGYPEDIISGSLDETQSRLNDFMIPDIINKELTKFLLEPEKEYI